jgi:uncharacterized membrane protein
VKSTNALLLALIVLLAIGLRCFNLSTLGYWTDEFCTLSDAQGRGLDLVRVPLDRPTGPTPAVTRLANARSITDVAAGVARDDSHPPLYFLIVRLWEDLFGDGESAVRSVGVIASVAVVILVYTAAAQTVGPAAALRAALITAVAVPQIQFAQEARNYMPAEALSMAAVVAFLRLRRVMACSPGAPGAGWGEADSGRRIAFANPTLFLSIAFAIALLAMMLTHYYTASIALVLVGRAVTAPHGRPRRNTLIAAAVAATIFAALWGLRAIAQTRNIGPSSAWLGDTAPGHGVRTLQRICILPVRLITELPRFGPPALWTVLGGLMTVWLIPLWIRRPDLRFWILLAAAPVAVVAAVDTARHSQQLFWLRYTLLGAPAVYVLIAASVRSRRLQYVPTGIAVAVSLVSLQSAYVPDWKIDFRTPVESIGRRLKPGDALVISGPDKTLTAITKAAFDHYLPVQPSMTLVLDRPPTESDRREISRRPTVWIVWMWPGRSIDASFPGERVDPTDRGTIPGFAELASGHPR